MKLSRTHVAYWQGKQQPKWTIPLTEKMHFPSIDDVIHANENGPFKYSKEHENEVSLANTLSLLRRGKNRPPWKKDELIAYLRNLIASPGTLINPEKRQANAKRILKAFLKSKSRKT